MNRTKSLFFLIIVTLLPAFGVDAATGVYYLPDTGQTTCYNDKGGSRLIACPAPGNSLAQDGSYSIYPPVLINNDDGTALDNNTWLTWQIQDDDVLRTWDEAVSYCDGLMLGNQTDWRLPTRVELTSIVDYGRFGPALDASIFPNAGLGNYWTSTVRPVYAGNYAVALDNGTVSYRDPSNRYRTRCVRGTPMTTDDFVANADNVTITDRSTGLTWPRARTGNGQGSVLILNWADALNYCEGLVLGGYSDWRLPNVKEASTFRDLNNIFFSQDSEFYYIWTSTSYLKDLTRRFVVSTLWDDPVLTYDKSDKSNVTLFCVRGQQATKLDPQELSVSLERLDFWDMGTTSIKTRVLTVSNPGRWPLLVGNIVPPAQPFSIISDNCSSTTLSPGASCGVALQFDSPPVPGVSTAAVTVVANDLDSPEVVVTLTGTVSPLPGRFFFLPDANSNICLDEYAAFYVSCPNPGQPGAQDASYSINEPSLLSNTGGTVLDNNTRLVWQKEDDGVARTWDDAKTYCDNLSLDSYSDWRLPSKRELLGIVDYSQVLFTDRLLADMEAFPNTKGTYWTADEDGKYQYRYLQVNFLMGVTWGAYSSSSAYARCVRGDELPGPILLPNGDGTVADLATGLTWQQQGVVGNWPSAQNYCESLNLGGYSDWRAPNIKELESITDSSRWETAIDADVFPPVSDSYWVSTAAGSRCEVWPQYDEYADYYEVSGTSGQVLGCPTVPYRGGSLALNRGILCVRGGDIRPALSHIEGEVKDLSSGLAMDNVSVTIVNSRKTSSTLTKTTLSYLRKQMLGGYYMMHAFDPGPFTATFEKAGYGKIVVEGTFVAGQFTTLNVQLGVVPPLMLSIDSPADNAVVSSSPITVTGTVNNNGQITVNSVAAITNPDNTYTASVPLAEGVNAITAVANDSFGQTTSTSIIVILVLPPPGSLTGTVTEAGTGVPLAAAAVSITDASSNGHNTVTDNNGIYGINGVAAGTFSGMIAKTGYSPATISGTIPTGQTTTADAMLSPVLPVISGIIEGGVTTSSATISWTTDQMSSSRVDYGTTTSYGGTVSDASLVTSHSLSLAGLASGTTYHFRVISTNQYGISSASADNTFRTLSALPNPGGTDNVAVIEVGGNYDAKNPDGSNNDPPRQDVARTYFAARPDVDFLIALSTFDYAMPEAGANGFYLEVRNDAQGINRPLLNNSSLYGSAGMLQGIVELGNVTNLAAAPFGPKLDETLTVLSHELMHRFGAYVRYLKPDLTLSMALLGKDSAHWSYLLDTKGSLMYGSGWRDNGDGTFTATAGQSVYSPLDLYLFGMIPKEQVPAMLLIDNAAIDPTQHPQLGSTVAGTATTVTIDDIVAAEGDRIPSAAASQKQFTVGFALLIRPGDNTVAGVQAVETVRKAFAGRFVELTQAKGSFGGVAPEMILHVDSPANGATVVGPDVTVTGAVINTTGAETGVLVNGVPATLSGCRFTAAHVPLDNGANTITVMASDNIALTATATIGVTATSGDFLRIVANKESGLTPLDVSFTLDGSFVIANPTITVSGPVAVPVVAVDNAASYSANLPVEGTCTITASAVGPDSQTYSDTVTISVQSRQAMESLLRRKWDGMKQAIIGGDVDMAMTYFVPFAQERYRTLANDPTIELAARLAEIERLDLRILEGKMAEAGAIRMEDAGEISYPVTFVLDDYGVWKILGF